MKQETDIALAVVRAIDAAGHLKGSAAKDMNLLPILEAAVAGRLRQEREDWIKFIEWWGDYAHNAYHVTTAPAEPWVPRDVYHCQHPLCLSLVGTLTDLTQNKPPRPPEVVT